MDFTKAANGQLTCCVNGVRLHSYYNPQKEADRFAASVCCDFEPSYVLVVEPAFSYCAQPLHQRFPQAVLCCVRLSHEFASYDNLWQKVFNVTDLRAANNGQLNDSLAEQIFAFMAEEGVCSCAFLSWKPAESAFPKEAGFAWQQIRKAVQKGMSVLSTRKYFARRWTKNALRLSLFAKKTARIKQGDAAVVVCASGPSLERNIPLLRQYRSRFFLVAVSSALSVLLHEGLTPDLCVSTDGGYWAKLHLAPLDQRAVPLALAAEGSCFAHIIESNTLIPLVYPDGCSKAIIRAARLCALGSTRCGTVSGTAAYLALSITQGDVFFCGLDLATSKGFAHAQPNALEMRSSLCDYRLSTAETRSAKASLPPPRGEPSAMQIYRSWFSTQRFPDRIFRLDTQKPSDLGTLKGASWQFFDERTNGFAQMLMPAIKETQHIRAHQSERKEVLKEVVRQNAANSEWVDDALALESTLLKRSSHEKKQEAAQKIEEEMRLFCDDVIRAVGI